MTEVAGKTFRYIPPAQDVIDLLLGGLAPSVRETVLAKIEPALMQRDRALEDAVTRALACCHE